MANQDGSKRQEEAARAYCSEHNDAEPLAGTADTVDVWLCLEYRPTWKSKVLLDNALTPATETWFRDTVAAFASAGLKARPQFVRQPEAESELIRLLVVVDGQTYQFSGRGYQYLEALDLLALVRATRENAPGGLAEVAERLIEPRYLICTNGQRDLCCARFGLPVYTALKERVGERVWQVTHLGGHRFAPNLLSLPDGCLYGRVTPEGLDGFLDRTESGQVDFRYLRGRTLYPPVVQAAEAALGRQSLRLLHVEERAEGATVQFAHQSDRLTIEMRRAEKPWSVLKSCGDEMAADVYPFVPV